MKIKAELLARISLAFLWLFTALTSLFWAREIGYQVLASGGITGELATLCIVAGSAIDCLIAIWLLSQWRLSLCYLVQIIIIVVYTILLSIIAPEFWWHPFGPLTKNIPILALLLMLYRNR